MKLSPSIKGILLGISLNALRLNFPSLLHPHNFLFKSIERFSQLIPIVQSYWPAEIFLNTFKISLLLKPLQHWSGNLSLSIWNFWKIWVRWQSNFDSLPAVDELYFWYLDIHMYTCSQLKKMEFVPRSPKIKSDKKAACFIPNSKN